MFAVMPKQKFTNLALVDFHVVTREGLEPPTKCLERTCSIQLSYRANINTFFVDYFRARELFCFIH